MRLVTFGVGIDVSLTSRILAWATMETGLRREKRLSNIYCLFI